MTQKSVTWGPHDLEIGDQATSQTGLAAWEQEPTKNQPATKTGKKTGIKTGSNPGSTPGSKQEPHQQEANKKLNRNQTRSQTRTKPGSKHEANRNQTCIRLDTLIMEYI